MTISSRTCEGPDCDTPLPTAPSGGGRRRFCSTRCRGRAARARAATLTEKRCGACKQIKPISEFHAAYRGYCKECQLAKHREAYAAGKPYRGSEKSYDASLRRLYGITLAEYEAMLAAQAGRCAICGERCEDRLHVDHHHITGAVRDLLCGRCNTAIGAARENPDVLRAMIAYLDRHKDASSAREGAMS